MAQRKKRMMEQVEIAIKEYLAPFPFGTDLMATELTEKLRDIIIPASNPTILQDMMEALHEVTGMIYELNGGQMAKFAAELLDKAHVTPKFIREVYGENGSYFDNFWSGMKGELPNEKMIRASIGLAILGWPKRGSAQVKGAGMRESA